MMHAVTKFLKEKNKQVVFAITGGGSQAISEILAAGSASDVVLDAQIPYSKESLDKYLGQSPDKYCSPETACMMAAKAWFNGLKLGADSSRLIGVGVTASLIKDGLQCGEVELHSDGSPRAHRGYISLHERESTKLYLIELKNPSRNREDEEGCLAECIGDLLRNAYPWVLMGDDKLVVEEHTLDGVVGRRTGLPNNPFDLCCIPINITRPSKFIYSGSFNPFHEGHEKVCRHIYEKYGEPVSLEISLFNRDKSPVDYISLYNRKQNLPFGKDYFGGLYVTTSPYFADKIKIFPNHRFIVGGDTWNRLLEDGIDHRLEDKFVVMPRDKAVKEYNKDGISMIPQIEWSFDAMDISSTQIRKQL
jgi:hypothetical protein